jgi:hypothetical protein
MYMNTQGKDPHQVSQSGLDGEISAARLAKLNKSNLGSAKKI